MIDVNRQSLLELLKASLFGHEPSFPDDTDWDAVLQEAVDQTVVALAAPFVPETEADKWRIPSAQNTAHFLRVIYAQTALIGLFEKAGIPVVVLKGSAAAMYYTEPLRRAMGDVDFIVPPASFDEARGILEENGYLSGGDYGDDRDYNYIKSGIVFELHHHYSDEGWDIEPLILEGLSMAQTRSVCSNSFPALPDAINGLVLLDHVRHHLYGGLGLRQIIDWMMFVHSMPEESLKTEFLPLAREAGLYKLACVMTKLCKKWLGMPDKVDWCEEADEKTSEQLLEAVFTSGNFGRKDPYEYRPMEALTMSVREDGLFKALQDAGLANWKAAQKYRFLRPFAWIYQLFRYIFRGIKAFFKGADFRKDIANGSEKNDFYERLGINSRNNTEK